MSWRHYSNLSVPSRQSRRVKERYSITSDILSFQICRRQYGFFAVRKYQPAHVAQLWYGIVIHQVLDKLHMQYKGLLGSQRAHQPPDDSDVEHYFNQVENNLRARGIRAVGDAVRSSALKVLKIFNRIEGPILYPYVEDTECTLESDQGDYIMHGKVDLLRNVSSGLTPEDYDPVEIWDYKGAVSPIGPKLDRYIFQMLVYAELYRRVHGRYPLKGVLYFLNQLNTDPEPEVRPTEATLEIDFRVQYYLDQIQHAMHNFSSTVTEIEQCINQSNWNAPQEPPDEETCDICDLRWSCRVVNYPMRYP